MAQGAAYESSDYTTGAAARGDTVADRFNDEFSLDDMRQFYEKQRASYADTSSGGHSSASAVYGDMEIVDEGSKSTIYSSGKSGEILFDNRNGQVSSTEHLSRSGWQYPGNADRYFGTGDSGSKFSYDQVQMSSNSGDAVAKDPTVGQNPRRAEIIRRFQETVAAAGNPDENREKASAIRSKLLDGKEISKELNELPPEQRRAVVRELKRQLAEMPGTVVSEPKELPGKPGDPSTRSIYTKYQTKDGTVVAIEEGAIGGEPRQIQVNGTGLKYKLSGAREVYSDGQSKPDSSTGFNPVLRLRELAVPFTQEEMERAQERKRQSGEK